MIQFPVKARMRVFSWVIIIVNLLFVAGAIAFIVLGNQGSSCGKLSKNTCTDLRAFATGFWLVLLLVVWAVVDVILGVLWLVTRQRDTEVVVVQPAAATPAPTFAAAYSTAAAAPSPVPVAAPARRVSVTVARRGRRRGAVIPAPPYYPAQVIKGAGNRVFDVDLWGEPKVLTFTCGGSWGRTVLQCDSSVVVDETGAYLGRRVVEPVGHLSRLEVITDGTWTVFLEDVRAGV